MCKIKDTNLGIKKLDFSKLKGKFMAYLTNGREITVPVSMFPDIKRMSLAKREEWMILDGQFFTFNSMSRIYSVKDLLRI